MSEDTDLLARISRLAGQINRQRDKPKTQAPGLPRQLGSPGIQKVIPARTRPLATQAAPGITSSMSPFKPNSKDHSVQTQASHGRIHRLTHDGLQYIVTDDGRMLVRDTTFGDPEQPTPHTLTIHGVSFRNKHGHLLRHDAPPSTRSSKYSTRSPDRSTSSDAKPCKRFTATGQCPRGSKCFGVHDPAKVAICREYLNTGHCPRGSQCDLSHSPTYERAPACVHFLRGSCSKEHCRYPHVKIGESGSVCSDFARIGFCTKGTQCPDRHLFECPDYTNKGKCKHPKCRLPHIDKAAQLRARESNTKSADQPGDGFLPPEIDQNDQTLDQDVIEPDATGSTVFEHADFIPLG